MYGAVVLFDDRVRHVDDLFEEKYKGRILPFCKEISIERAVIGNRLLVAKGHLYKRVLIDGEDAAVLERRLAFAHFIVNKLLCLSRLKPRAPRADKDPDEQ